MPIVRNIASPMPFIGLSLVALLWCGVAWAECGGVKYDLGDLVYDMGGSHEAVPNGVDHDWELGPRPASGAARPPAGWTAAIAWGQIYVAEGGSPAENVRVHICNMRTWTRDDASGEWTLADDTDEIGGALYLESFADDDSIEADIRAEPEGGISVTLEEGRNFHFWPAAGRIAIDPLTLGAVVTTFDARLIVDDPEAFDDRSSAALLAGSGGDYWESPTAQWDNWETNRDFGIGKLKRLIPEWRTFGAFSGPAERLLENPPPISDQDASADDGSVAEAAFVEDTIVPSPVPVDPAAPAAGPIEVDMSAPQNGEGSGAETAFPRTRNDGDRAREDGFFDFMRFGDAFGRN